MDLRGAKVAVTGAFSYTGQYIARDLQRNGAQVITLTRDPNRPHPLRETVRAFPLDFSEPGKLIASLAGCQALVNTYWVRYNYPGSSFEQAVENSLLLVDCSIQAGVQRLVHISVSQPRPEDPLPYFAGKHQVEELINAAGISYCILRPTIVFGDEEVLINNITWLLRHWPVFAIPGNGHYSVQPVFVEDVAAQVTEGVRAERNETIDLGGPETYTFKELLALLMHIGGSRALLVPVPPSLALALSKIVGFLMQDLMLTGDELAALIDERLIVDGSARCPTRFSLWAAEHAATLGKHYVNELRRHHGVH